MVDFQELMRRRKASLWASLPKNQRLKAVKNMRTNELCVVLMPQHITAFSIQATVNKTTVFFNNNTQETYNKGLELLVQNFVDVQ